MTGLRALLLAAALTAGALAACGVPERPPTFVADDQVPFGLLADTTTTAVAESGPARPRIQVCFVRGTVVVPVERDPRGDGVPGALAALVAGPSQDDQATGLRTALLTEDAIRDVSVSGGVARVDLTPSFAIGGTADSILALAQLVCTLTAQPGVGQVSFTLEGQPVEVPLTDGSLAARAVTRDDYAGLIVAAGS